LIELTIYINWNLKLLQRKMFYIFMNAFYLSGRCFQQTKKPSPNTFL